VKLSTPPTVQMEGISSPLDRPDRQMEGISSPLAREVVYASLAGEDLGELELAVPDVEVEVELAGEVGVEAEGSTALGSDVLVALLPPTGASMRVPPMRTYIIVV